MHYDRSPVAAGRDHYSSRQSHRHKSKDVKRARLYGAHPPAMMKVEQMHSSRVIPDQAQGGTQREEGAADNGDRANSMTQMAELTSTSGTSGRKPTKFTQERISQIRNLVEQGTSREEIAKLIEVTVGSLQVTCSRLGISLRRPNANTAAGLPRLGTQHCSNGGAMHSPKSDEDIALQPASEQTEQRSRSASGQQVQPRQEGAEQHRADPAKFTVTIRYKDEEREIDLALTHVMIARLAFEAHFCNMRMTELLGNLITATINKDLFQQVLDTERAANGPQTLLSRGCQIC